MTQIEFFKYELKILSRSYSLYVMLATTGFVDYALVFANPNLLIVNAQGIPFQFILAIMFCLTAAISQFGLNLWGYDFGFFPQRFFESGSLKRLLLMRATEIFLFQLIFALPLFLKLFHVSPDLAWLGLMLIAACAITNVYVCIWASAFNPAPFEYRWLRYKIGSRGYNRSFPIGLIQFALLSAVSAGTYFLYEWNPIVLIFLLLVFITVYYFYFLDKMAQSLFKKRFRLIVGLRPTK
jgi:hypothetical protein